MSTTGFPGFNWADALQNRINAETVRVAALNAQAPIAYADSCQQWIASNVQERGMVSNQNFTPTPMPVIPHKKGVSLQTGDVIDLGPFPDLVPPVLPPYMDAVSIPLAGNNPEPSDGQKLSIIAAMLQAMGADIAAIKTALKV